MGKAEFSDDFKRDAVHQIVELGYQSDWASAQISLRLDEEVFECIW